MFLEGARLLSRVDFECEAFAPYRSFHTVIAHWLVNYLAGDESRQMAFGTQLLSRLVPELSPTRSGSVGSWKSGVRRGGSTAGIEGLPRLQGGHGPGMVGFRRSACVSWESR